MDRDVECRVGWSSWNVERGMRKLSPDKQGKHVMVSKDSNDANVNARV